MTGSMVALSVNALICILLPMVILAVFFKKNKQQRGIQLMFFLVGAALYVAMEWGVKEHGLTWLFNHTDFLAFSKAHYISYLFIVALAGTLLCLIPVFLFVCFGMKKKCSMVKACELGLGYSMAEAVLLVGIRSVNTILELICGTDLELGSSVGELLLSGYERVVISIIHIGIFVLLIYFMQQKLSVRGFLLFLVIDVLVQFLPGFIIAFSTMDFLELYDRSVALVLVQLLLTMTAICMLFILNSLRYQLKD